MYLIVTRSFPPELGGMQSLMWGLSRELSKNFMIKVFADYIENHKTFDEQVSFSIERVGGPKLLRKYRKAYLIDEFVKDNNFNFPYLHDDTQEIAKSYDAVCTPDFFGYNKDLALQYRGRLRELKKFMPVKDGESDLLKAMKQIAKTGKGPDNQTPSAGCGIKWKQ